MCRDDLNVTVFGDGSFETSVWYVGAKAARTVRTVALHENKAVPSYRQGRVIGRRTTRHEGKTRYNCHVRDDGRRVVWVGDGSGEKRDGYG